MECVRDSYFYQHTVEFTRTREDCEPSTLDLIFTNEEDMIEDLNYDSPLGRSDHCVLYFKFRCYCKTDEEKPQRWNFYKGDYSKMAEEMNCDWETLLKDKSADKKFDIFLEKNNIAKEKCIPQTNSRAGKKAKKHNYICIYLLMKRLLKKIKRNVVAGKDIWKPEMVKSTKTM